MNTLNEHEDEQMTLDMCNEIFTNFIRLVYIMYQTAGLEQGEIQTSVRGCLVGF